MNIYSTDFACFVTLTISSTRICACFLLGNTTKHGAWLIVSVCMRKIVKIRSLCMYFGSLIPHGILY